LNKDEFGDHLADLLLNHYVPQKLALSDIIDQVVTSLAGDTLTFRSNKNDRRFVNDNRIESEIIADNGIVHAVEGVILPSWASETAYDVIGKKSELGVFYGLLPQANLDVTLAGDGPFTVFAPLNKALEETNLDIDSEAIAAMLNKHVVEGIYPSNSITDGLGLPTIQGEEVLFTVIGDTVTVNGKKIVETNYLSNNGIMHVIEGVMEPEGIENGTGETPSAPIAGSATQACSICTGSPGTFILNNADASIDIPDSIVISTIETSEAPCNLVEQACQIGFCNAEACNALASSGASETCGCQEA